MLLGLISDVAKIMHDWLKKHDSQVMKLMNQAILLMVFQAKVRLAVYWKKKCSYPLSRVDKQ